MANHSKMHYSFACEISPFFHLIKSIRENNRVRGVNSKVGWLGEWKDKQLIWRGQFKQTSADLKKNN